jgi:hypothetical protein
MVLKQDKLFWKYLWGTTSEANTLYWSQEISYINLKAWYYIAKKEPNLSCNKTPLWKPCKEIWKSHIIILNFIKAFEKKPRETVFSGECANAIELIKRDLPKGSQLKFRPWDIHEFSKKETTQQTFYNSCQNWPLESWISLDSITER